MALITGGVIISVIRFRLTDYFQYEEILVTGRLDVNHRLYEKTSHTSVCLNCHHSLLEMIH
jgi:hypothetical protein